ncbi:MAG: hypothetical protein IKQ55_13745 [Kiritimatiellae bacterium]|nr:hypothetical protein [Kiritimatiellia bacterium]MBR4191008.1 hypothetical protein [Kiritimatiellia bacterium]
MKARRCLHWGLLAGWLAALGAAGALAREPDAIRRLDPQREPKMAQRIEMWRERLDESLRERYNFAWCIARVEGLARREYIAHSGLGGPEDLSEEAWNRVRAVVSPDVPEEARHYRTLCVNRRNQIDGDDCWDRDQDTEFKILEALTARLPDRQAAGTVVLFTDLPPCASCRLVIGAFLDRYPNIRLEVLYK